MQDLNNFGSQLECIILGEMIQVLEFLTSTMIRLDYENRNLLHKDIDLVLDGMAFGRCRQS